MRASSHFQKNKLVTSILNIDVYYTFAGGYDIEKECGLLSKNREPSYGDVFVGGAGKLRCKKIFHVIAPEWRGGSHKEEKLLRNTVKNCFDKMLEKKLTSIAMSAIGTGRFRFPKTEAIENIVTVLQTYVNTKETPFVKEVFLCDLQHDNVKGFVKELKKIFSDIKVYDLKDQPNEEGKLLFAISFNPQFHRNSYSDHLRIKQYITQNVFQT